MRRSVLCWVIVACALRVLSASPLANGISTAVGPNGAEYAKGHVLVQLRGDLPPVGTALFGGTVGMVLPSVHVARLDFSTDANVFGLVAKLGKEPGVTFAEPDFVVHGAYVPNDQYWSQQYGPQRINCTAAWDIGKGDAGTVVAILDTGVDYTHPDLRDKYAGGYDFFNNDADPMDDAGHGTFCAGIAAAETDNLTGIAGVGFNCRFMAVKVLGQTVIGLSSMVAQGIEYATANGAKIISMSLLIADRSQTLEAACTNAWDNGVVLCAAAGNYNWSIKNYPAAYPACIAVGATDQNDARASFSNYGADWVDVAAPGVDVLSTGSGGSYYTGSGTSAATPHVAGLAALLYSKLGGRAPVKAMQVRYLIESTCDYVGDWVDHGRINAGRAMAAAHQPPTETTYNAASAQVEVGKLLSSDVSNLWTADGDDYRVYSDVIATWWSGPLSGQSYGTAYSVTFNLGTGPRLSGTLEMKAAASTPATLSIQLFNWRTGAWGRPFDTRPLEMTESSITIPLPPDPQDYVTGGHLRVRLSTTGTLRHELHTDLFRLRMIGY